MDDIQIPKKGILSDAQNKEIEGGVEFEVPQKIEEPETVKAPVVSGEKKEEPSPEISKKEEIFDISSLDPEPSAIPMPPVVPKAPEKPIITPNIVFQQIPPSGPKPSAPPPPPSTIPEGKPYILATSSKTMEPTISGAELDKLKPQKGPISISLHKKESAPGEPKTEAQSSSQAVRFMVPEGKNNIPKKIQESPESPSSKSPISVTPKGSAPQVSGETSDIPTLRTYKQDIASAIKEQKTSLVRMVLEEQKGRTKRELEESPKSRKNFPLIILSVVFLFGSIGVIYFSFFRGSTQINTLVELNVTPLINTETNKEISTDSLSTAQGIKAISDEVKTSKPRLDTIEYLFFTQKITEQTPEGLIESKEIVSSKGFFGFIGIELPNVLVRALKPEYMFGIHAFNGNQPFLIIKTDYYDTAFSGMLEWEKRLPQDLLPIFGRSENISALTNRSFGDMIVKNKDTRVIRTPDGEISIIYMFKDQKTVIITTNEDTLLKISTLLDLSREKEQ